MSAYGKKMKESALGRAFGVVACRVANGMDRLDLLSLNAQLRLVNRGLQYGIVPVSDRDGRVNDHSPVRISLKAIAPEEEAALRESLGDEIRQLHVAIRARNRWVLRHSPF